MTTAAYVHELRPGETLVADVTLLAAPFTWSVEVAAENTVERRLSISEAAGDWLEPPAQASIEGSAYGQETAPLRFLRWRHASGTDAATVRLAGWGRVEWIES